MVATLTTAFQTHFGAGSFWDKTADDPVAYFTFWLVVFTAVLSLVSTGQIFFLTRTDKSTRVAAQAARDAADASVGMERPFVYLEKLALDMSEFYDVDDTICRPHVYFLFKNYGRSPAFLVGVHLSLYIGAALPDSPTYGEGSDNTTVVEAGTTYEFTWKKLDFDPPLDKIWDVVAGKARLWIYGVLVYEDFAGKEHRTGFCGSWVPRDVEVLNSASFARPSRSPYIYRT
jgi:hypothetical protein